MADENTGFRADLTSVGADGSIVSRPDPKAVPAEAPLVPLELAQRTPQVFNPAGERVNPSWQDIPQAVISGQISFKPEDKINVIGEDGKSYNLPGNQVATALQNGYRLEAPEEIAVREYVQANKGLSGTAKVGLGQFVDEALLGIPEEIYDHTADPLDRAKKDALKADHEYANTVGGIAGFGASMLYGGEAFNAAGKVGVAASRVGEKAIFGETAAALVEKLVASGVERAAAERAASPLVRSMTTNAIKYGVEGGLLASPMAVTEAALGDFDAAAEHLVYGIGGGALLGQLGPLASKFRSVAEAGLEAGAIKVGDLGVGGDGVLGKLKTYAEELSYKLQAKNAGALKSNVSKIGAEGVVDSSRVLSEGGYINNGIKGKDAVADNIGRALEDGWTKMDSAITGLDNRAEEIRQLAAEPGSIGIVEELEKLSEKFKYSSDANKKAIVEDAISNFMQDAQIVAQSETPLKELHNIRRSMDDKLTFNAADAKPLNKLKEQIRGIYSSKLNGFIDNVATKLEQPELAAAWKEGNQLYSAGKDYQKFLTNDQNAFIGNRLFGLTDNIVGAAGIASTALGNPAGLLGIAGKKALESSYGQTGIASLLYKFSQLGGEKAGILFTEQAMKESATQLDRIPGILTGKWNIKPTASTIGLSAMNRFIGSDKSSDNLSERRKTFDELARKVREVNANPEKTASQLAALAAPIAIGAPGISAAYVAQMTKVYQHLQSMLPQSAKTDDQFNLFKKPVQQMSDKELADFERSLRIIENPYYILDSLQTGTITKGQVDTLAALYPKMYEGLKAKIAETAATQDLKDVPYSARLRLSLLMGVSLDPSIKSTASYQQSFAKQQATPPAKSNLNLITPKSNPYATPITKAYGK